MKRSMFALLACLVFVSTAVLAQTATDTCRVSFGGKFFKPASVALEYLSTVCGYEVVYPSANDVPGQLVNLDGMQFGSANEALTAILDGVPFVGTIGPDKHTITVKRQGLLGSSHPKAQPGTTNRGQSAIAAGVEEYASPNSSNPWGRAEWMRTVGYPQMREQAAIAQLEEADLAYRASLRYQSAGYYRGGYSNPRGGDGYYPYSGYYGNGYIDPVSASWALKLKGAATHGYLKIYAVGDTAFAKRLIVKRKDENGVWRVVGAGGKSFRNLHDPMELPVGKQRLRFEERRVEKGRGGVTYRFEEEFEIDSKYDRENPLQYPVSAEMFASVENVTTITQPEEP